LNSQSCLSLPNPGITGVCQYVLLKGDILKELSILFLLVDLSLWEQQTILVHEQEKECLSRKCGIYTQWNFMQP
jgi:hypothetical protein